MGSQILAGHGCAVPGADRANPVGLGTSPNGLFGPSPWLPIRPAAARQAAAIRAWSGRCHEAHGVRRDRRGRARRRTGRVRLEHAEQLGRRDGDDQAGRQDATGGRADVGRSLAFDQKTLDAMATSTATIFEPFVKKDIRFTGIPMSDLLTRAGVAPTATKVNMHALDDYKVEFKVPDLMAPGVLLATRADGAAIPIGKGGPIRLVFPPGSTAGKNKDVWIWSIDSMTIR